MVDTHLIGIYHNIFFNFCVWVGRIKRIKMKTANKIYISIVLLLVFAFSWYFSSSAAANQNIERNTQRQQIINSIFSVDKINSNDKDLIISFDESDSKRHEGTKRYEGTGALC